MCVFTHNVNDLKLLKYPIEVSFSSIDSDYISCGGAYIWSFIGFLSMRDNCGISTSFLRITNDAGLFPCFKPFNLDFITCTPESMDYFQEQSYYEISESSQPCSTNFSFDENNGFDELKLISGEGFTFSLI